MHRIRQRFGWRTKKHNAYNTKIGDVVSITEDDHGLNVSVEWDIDANLPMYTRDYLKLKKEADSFDERILNHVVYGIEDPEVAEMINRLSGK